MTKKIVVDENRKFFFGKGLRVKLWNFSSSLKFFSEIGGNLKQGEMHHCLRGMDAPGWWSVLVFAGARGSGVVSSGDYRWRWWWWLLYFLHPLFDLSVHHKHTGHV